MAVGALDDVLETDPPPAARARLADIAAIDPPAPAARVATLDDIAGIEPPVQAPAAPPEFLPGHPTSISSIPGGTASWASRNPDERGVIQSAAPAQAQMGPPSILPGPAPQPVDAEPPHPEARIGAPVPVAAAEPRRLGSAKTGGAAVTKPGTMPILDDPSAGVRQAAGGASVLLKQLARPQVLPADPHVMPIGPNTADTMSAASDVLEGTARAALPLAIGAGVAAPVSTAVTIAAAVVAQKAAAKGVELAGGSPEAARLAGNVAATVAGSGVGTREVLAKMARDASAVAGQARAHDAAYPPEAPVSDEPISVGRGATPAARGERVLPPERQALPPAPEPPSPPPPDQPAPIAAPGGSPAGTAEPRIDAAAAVRDLAQAQPNSPEAQTAIAALRADGWDDIAIAAAVRKAGAVAEPPTIRQQVIEAERARDAAAGVPDNPVAQQLEAERRAIERGETPPTASADDVVAIEPPSQETPNAVPEPSGDAVDVRQPADNGEAVGVGDTEPQAPAGTGDTAAGNELAPPPGAAPAEPPGSAVATPDDVAQVAPPAAAQLAHLSDQDLHAILDTYEQHAGPLPPEHEAAAHDIVEELMRRGQQPAATNDQAPAPVAGKAEPRSVRAPVVEWAELSRPQQQEVRRILLEMQELAHAGKTFQETARRGGDVDVKGRVAGAPVYWDIVGGNPKGRPTFNYDRGAVTNKLRQFVENGKRSVVSDLAVDVASRRLAGDRSLSPAMLPPDAGAPAVAVRRLSGLDPDRAAVQERAAAMVEDHPADLAARYRQRFDNVVSADNAKELFPDYATPAQRTANDIAVHRPASRLAQHVYDQLLDEPVRQGRDPFVVLTAGGTGSGKTSSLDLALPGVRESAHAVYDSTLSDLGAARVNIASARAAGHDVVIVLTDRDVDEAFRSTLERAQGHGRPVTLNTHVASHMKAPAVFAALMEEYAADPHVQLFVVRNSTAGGRELVPLADWTPRRYNEGDVRANLSRTLEGTRAGLGEGLYTAVRGAAKDAAPSTRRGADARGSGDLPADAASGRPAENAGGPGEVVDTLDTGEQQPRLPEAGQVRDRNIQTPTIDAPFSLTGGADVTPREQPQNLFGKGAAPARGRSGSGGHASMALPAQKSTTTPTAPAAGGTPPAAAGGGTTVDAAFVPGGRQFYERDVVPALQKLFDQLKESSRGVREVLAPDTIGQPAVAAAGVVRATKALEAQQLAQAHRILKSLMKTWDQVPREEQLAFAMAIDEGRVDDLPDWQRDAAKLFAEINDVYRREVRQRGGFRHGYIDDYFPRQWDKPGKVTQWLRGSVTARRPFKGRQGFRKQRARNESGQIFTFREMYDAGFRPVNYNPVEAWLNKWVEMRKWISAYDIVREHKRVGVAKFIRVGGAAPEGWRRYPDSYGTVYGKPAVTVREAFDPQLRGALEKLIADLGVKHARRVNLGKSTRWGYASQNGKAMATKFGGPDGVIMHELGHILDFQFGLGAKIGAELADEARSEKDFGEKSWAKRELAALADLRIEGAANVTPGYKAYIRNKYEKVANLVHGFLYAPERVKAIAPNSYWALYNLAKDTPELRPLLTLQKTRGLGLGTDEREVRIPGALISGYYYGPDEAVRLMEHYLSPGLAGSPAYRGFRAIGNVVNQVQLGLSAFHATMTSLNAVMSKTAVGLEHLSRGHLLEGLTKLATSPAAPFVDLWRGHQALQALRTTSPSTQTFADIASQIVQAGGREGWDPFWHQDTAVKKWLQAWRGMAAEAKAGNYPGAAARAGVGLARTFPTLIEAQAKPIMEFFVPRLKMAAFLDLARLELDDLGDVPDLVEGRKALAKAWDTVDNRFGELIYDNLFWDNRLKDAALAIVRAPGWNIGTLREVFGAIPAQLRQVGALPAAGGGGIGKPPSRVRNVGADADGKPEYETGSEPRLTHKFAYFVSMLFWTAVLGAVTQYLHTGLKPGEQEDGTIDPGQIPLDLYFPRREKAEGTWKRVVLPTYMRDLYAAAHNFPYGLGTAAIHKVHPLWTLAIEFLKNEDYWGTEVRNPDDAAADQAAQLVDWLTKEVQPIGIKSMRESGHPVESMVGLSPAPAYVTRSALENYLRDVAPPTHRTLDQAKQGDVRREIRKDLAGGDRAAAAELARNGVLTSRQVQAAVTSTRLSQLQRGYQSLTLEQAIHGYEVATPEERRALQPLLRRKASTAQVSANDREAVKARLQKALALPVEGKAAVPVAAR